MSNQPCCYLTVAAGFFFACRQEGRKSGTRACQQNAETKIGNSERSVGQRRKRLVDSLVICLERECYGIADQRRANYAPRGEPSIGFLYQAIQNGKFNVKLAQSLQSSQAIADQALTLNWLRIRGASVYFASGTTDWLTKAKSVPLKRKSRLRCCSILASVVAPMMRMSGALPSS